MSENLESGNENDSNDIIITSSVLMQQLTQVVLGDVRDAPNAL